MSDSLVCLVAAGNGLKSLHVVWLGQWYQVECFSTDSDPALSVHMCSSAFEAISNVHPCAVLDEAIS